MLNFSGLNPNVGWGNHAANYDNALPPPYAEREGEGDDGDSRQGGVQAPVTAPAYDAANRTVTLREAAKAFFSSSIITGSNSAELNKVAHYLVKGINEIITDPVYRVHLVNSANSPSSANAAETEFYDTHPKLKTWVLNHFCLKLQHPEYSLVHISEVTGLYHLYKKVCRASPENKTQQSLDFFQAFFELYGTSQGLYILKRCVNDTFIFHGIDQSNFKGAEAFKNPDDIENLASTLVGTALNRFEKYYLLKKFFSDLSLSEYKTIRCLIPDDFKSPYLVIDDKEDYQEMVKAVIHDSLDHTGELVLVELHKSFTNFSPSLWIYTGKLLEYSWN